MVNKQTGPFIRHYILSPEHAIDMELTESEREGF